MKKKGLSKLAVGALLACEVGSFGASANFMDSMKTLPGVGSIGDLLEGLSDFAKSNPILFSSLAGPWLAKLVNSIPGYLKKGKNYVKDLLESSGYFCSPDDVKNGLRSGFSKISGFKDTKKDLWKIAGEISQLKQKQEKDEEEEEKNYKKTRMVIVTCVNNSVRQRMVNSFANSLYSGTVLELDLSEYSKRGEIVSALLPGERSFFSGDKSDTPGDKLEKYKNKNEHGVVVIKLSRKGLEAADDIFANLLKYSSKGTTKLKDKKTLETGNLTLIVEVEDSISNVDSLKTLDFAYFVNFPQDYSSKEVSNLIMLSFARSIGYWQDEGINLNTKVLLRSLFHALKDAESVGFMDTMAGLSDDFNRYMASNEERFLKEGTATVYYDRETGEFCSKSKEQTKEASKSEISDEGKVESSEEVVDEKKQEQVKDKNGNHNTEQKQIVANKLNVDLQENKLETLR